MKHALLYDIVDTPLGTMTLVVARTGEVVELWTRDREEDLMAKGQYERDSEAVAHAAVQLREYTEGRRRDFDLKLAPEGTDFQKRVWAQLLQIPYGETRSYGQLAAAIGNPTASRAVGRANGTNPISVIIPCHRVIGSSGDLTGYGGGLPMKSKLLRLEGVLTKGLFDD